jgi:hypothetical protein
MSCAARYSETTSLEFILNPFKFFFTNYVTKIVPQPPPDIHHLETQFRTPTIFRSTSARLAVIAHVSGALRVCVADTSLAAPAQASHVSSRVSSLRCYTKRVVYLTISLLHRSYRLHAHTFVARCTGCAARRSHFFTQRLACASRLQRCRRCYMFVGFRFVCLVTSDMSCVFRLFVNRHANLFRVI